METLTVMRESIHALEAGGALMPAVSQSPGYSAWQSTASTNHPEVI